MGKLLLPIILGSVGIGVAVLATILGWVVMPVVIENQIKNEVRLVDGEETFEKWEVTPVPVYFDLNIFHVTNADEVNKDLTVKPVLEEIGPFVYEQKREKVDIHIDYNTQTIRYKEKITYTYDKELSGGKDETAEIYNIVNTPYMTIVQAAFLSDPILGELAQLLLGVIVGEKMVRKNVSVQNMMFDGIPLHPIYAVLTETQDPFPDEFLGNRFAFYRGKSGVPGDEYLIKTGVENDQEFGKIVEYNSQTNLTHWKVPTDWENEDKFENTVSPAENKFCNFINGTDGSVFPPFQKKDKPLRVFVSDLCRSIYLEYVRDMEHLDIPGYRFELPADFYKDPKDNQENYCYCTSPEGDLEDRCGEGVIRLAPCKSGAPIVTSSPHFYRAGKDFLDAVEGLSPDPNLHATFIELEPNTGLMLRIDKKLQISMEVQPKLPGFNGAHHYLFPAFWAREYTELDEKNADDLKSQLLTPLLIIDIAKWTILGIGIVLTAASAVLLIVRR